MSRHTGTVVGLMLLVLVVWLAIAVQGSHNGHDDVLVSIQSATPGPTPNVVGPTPQPTPAPAPDPDPFAPARWAAANVAVIFLMLAIAIGVPVGIALHNWHQAKLPTPLDWRVPYRAPQFPAALDAHVRTSFPPVPQTYSPSLHIRNDQVPEVEPPPQLAGPVPNAEALIAQAGAGHLVYGVRVDNGEPLIDNEIRSLLIGGQMGSGKSTLAALLAAQLHRQGARIVIGDPHALNSQSLTARVRSLVEPAQVEQEPRQIFHRVMEAWDELERRERLGDPDGLPPYVAVIDEFPELIRRLGDRDEERLRDALLVVGGLSGRKFKVAVIALGQSWKHSVIRSTEMRDLVSAQAVFHMRKDEALRLTNLGSDYWNPDPLLLQKGEAFIVGVVSGAVLVRVPLVEAPSRAHARGVSGVSPELSGGVHPGVPALSLPPPGGHSRDTSEDSGEDTSKDSEILRAFRHSGDVNRVIREVFNVEPGGQSWQRARQRVNAALLRALGR